MSGLELLSILGLIALFVLAALRPINIGFLGLAAAFLVGVVGAGFPAKEVLGGFPGDLFVTIVGITYLFGAARENGTIDWLVNHAAALVGDRPALMPFLVFSVAALLTALGALGPAAVAILAPLALRYAATYRLSPLLMGLATIHGAQAGAFSPVSVYGNITSSAMTSSGMEAAPIYLALASLAFNAAIFVTVYLVLTRRKWAADTRSATEGTAAALTMPELRPLERSQLITLAGLMALAVGTSVFRLDIGLLAVVIAVVLSLLNPKTEVGLSKVDWSTALLIAGVVTYVSVMERLGTISALGDTAAQLESPYVAALILCLIAGVVSAFSSSTALLGILVPLAAPVVAQGNLSAVGLVCAIAISTTIVDTSPFSTNGALVVANSSPDERDRLLRQLLVYTVLIVMAGPALAWAIFA